MVNAYCLYSEASRKENDNEGIGRLSRFDVDKITKICQRYDHHGSLEGLDTELTACKYTITTSIDSNVFLVVQSLKPEKKSCYQIMQANLPEAIFAILSKKYDQLIYSDASLSSCSSDKFVKEMTKRDRSASKTGRAERISSSGSSRSVRSQADHSSGQSSQGKNKPKAISSHETVDGVNYKKPETRKVVAKKDRVLHYTRHC